MVKIPPKGFISINSGKLRVISLTSPITFSVVHFAACICLLGLCSGQTGPQQHSTTSALLHEDLSISWRFLKGLGMIKQIRNTFAHILNYYHTSNHFLNLKKKKKLKKISLYPGKISWRTISEEPVEICCIFYYTWQIFQEKKRCLL